MVGHQQVCFGCGASILAARSHSVNNDVPERQIILRWTPLHLISRLNHVCMSCWLAARREVRRQVEPHMDIEVENVNVQNLVEPEAALPEPALPDPAPFEQRIISQKYKRVASTSRHCVFVGCVNPERLTIPAAVKEMFILHREIYIPISARVCRQHLEANIWEPVQGTRNDFVASQIDDMLAMLSKAAQRRIDFENVNNMEAHICHYWLGYTANQFTTLLTLLPSLRENSIFASTALCAYLVKLRTGDSDERLSSLFQLPRTTLDRYMQKVRTAFKNDFVPNHLGVQHMTIQEAASRNRFIPEGLFSNPNLPTETKPAIVTCDATYIYTQKSSNYSFQKASYSLHKHQNLVKPFLFVCCDGYILHSVRLSSAIKNDATIMQEQFGPLLEYFRPGDIFILERGFRDAIPFLEQNGYRAYMPASLLPGERQLTTQQANYSRFVTMCRWVVEVIHGRIKRDFKLLRQHFYNRAASHLMLDFNIACALTNKFHPVIMDKDEAPDYVNIAKSRVNMENRLGEWIITENINLHRRMFIPINDENVHLNNFPQLTLFELRRFALGSYQVKQAISYYGEHLKENGRWIVELANDIDRDLPPELAENCYLLRARIKSRYINRKIHFTYILVSNYPFVNPLDQIKGYYCSCLVGKRTVGCCSHTMTVLWYLSWARHQETPIIPPASFLDHLFDESDLSDDDDEDEDE